MIEERLLGRFLVTGATGFVGRHCCRQLLEQGHQVRAAVRRSSSHELSPPVETVEIDGIGPSTDWAPALVGIDVVIHLAGVAHRLGAEAQDASPDLFRVNAEGTAKLAADVASHGQNQRLVFLSSIGVVASTSETVLTEESPCSPTGDYGRSKLQGETEIRSILADSSSDWCIVRAPLVYGPGNPGNMARLGKLVRLRLPLPFSSIANRRSFVYVGNLTHFLLCCALHPDASRQTFLVSDSQDLSTPRLVRMIATSSGRRVILFPMAPGLARLAGRVGDWIGERFGLRFGLDTYSVDRLWGSLAIDASKARRLLGWNPPWDVETGLRRTFRAQPK